MENGIPPSVLLFYWIFFSPLILIPAFSDRLKIILLRAFMEVTEARAKNWEEDG